MNRDGILSQPIPLRKVLDVLVDLEYLTSDVIQSVYKPGHGPCCTCQACGWTHDECVCADNELLERLFELLPVDAHVRVEVSQGEST